MFLRQGRWTEAREIDGLSNLVYLSLQALDEEMSELTSESQT